MKKNKTLIGVLIAVGVVVFLVALAVVLVPSDFADALVLPAIFQYLVSIIIMFDFN